MDFKNYHAFSPLSNIHLFGFVFAVLGFICGLYFSQAGDSSASQDQRHFSLLLASVLSGFFIALMLSKVTFIGSGFTTPLLNRLDIRTTQKYAVAFIWSIYFALPLLFKFSLGITALCAIVILIINLGRNLFISEDYKNGLPWCISEIMSGTTFATMLFVFCVLISKLFWGKLLELKVVITLAIFFTVLQLSIRFFVKSKEVEKDFAQITFLEFLSKTGLLSTGYGIVTSMFFLKPEAFLYAFGFGVVNRFLLWSVPTNNNRIDIDDISPDEDEK